MKKMPKKREGTPHHSYSYTPQPERKNEMDYVHRIFESVIEEHKEKQTKVTVPENVKREELGALLGKLKSFDKRIDEKQKALSSQRKDEQQRIDQKNLNENMVDNI